MILHWFTTGWRSLIANPLFSLITIISLSIGCCGALLVGANIKQHLSFDRWIPAADRTWILSRHMDEASLGAGMRIGGLPKWDSTVPAPMRGALERLPGVEMMARSFRGQSLLPPDPAVPTTPPLPGDPPRPPVPGSIYVDPEFFDLLGLELVEGSADGLKEPNQIVITQTAAQRIFGNISPIGQMTEGANKRQFRVVGVVKDLPPETHLRFEAISSVRTFEQITAANNASQGGGMTPSNLSFNAWNGGSVATIYIRAKADADPHNFAATLQQAAQAASDEGVKTKIGSGGGGGGMFSAMPNPRYDYKAVPLLDIHLGGPEVTSFSSTGDIKLLITLGTAALALLVVSAFNYVTLSLARSLRRRREVAVRKVLGADQGALVRHYIAESAIVTAISLVIGFALAEFLHPWFARTIGQPETLFDLFDPVFLTASLVVFVLLALTVGAYPAFYLANTRPRTALGEGGAASPGRMSQWVTGGLMGLQISAATGLLIVSLTMTAQANFIANRWLGFETKDRYQIAAACPFSPQMAPDELSKLQTRCRTGVQTILSGATGASKPAFFQGVIVGGEQPPEAYGRSATGDKLGDAVAMRVDLEFLQTMGARLIAGRMFDSASAYDRALGEYNTAMMARMKTTVQSDGQGRTMIMMTSDDSGPGPVRPARVPVLVTAAMLPSLGVKTPDEAIGQQIALQPRSQNMFEIIGVVEDWNSRPLKTAVSPMIFIPQGGSQAIVEIPKATLESVNTQLTQAWRDYLGAPNASVQLRPLAQTLEATYRSDFLLMSTVTMFALVAIAVAGLGVYGLSAFEMRRRVREIGIRKALGASPYAVGALVIGRALVFAGIAAFIAWLPGFALANAWLSDFVYRTTLSWAVLPIATAIVVAFVALAVSLSAMRAAAVRPGMALRV